jgi:hypothetical protein
VIALRIDTERSLRKKELDRRRHLRDEFGYRRLDRIHRRDGVEAQLALTEA